MAKEITIQSPDGAETYYPKTVSDLVFDNGNGETVKRSIADLNNLINCVSEVSVSEHAYYNFVNATSTINLITSPTYKFKGVKLDLSKTTATKIRFYSKIWGNGNLPQETEGATATAFIAFGDEKNKVIVELQESPYYNVEKLSQGNFRVNIPQGAKYFYMNIKDTDEVLYYLEGTDNIFGLVDSKIEEVHSELTDLSTNVDNLYNINFSVLSNCYQTQGSIYKVNNANFNIAIFNVVGGVEYSFKSCYNTVDALTNTNYNSFAFFDKDKKVLRDTSEFPYYEDYRYLGDNLYSVKSPKNAAYFNVTVRTAQEPFCKILDNNSKFIPNWMIVNESVLSDDINYKLGLIKENVNTYGNCLKKPFTFTNHKLLAFGDSITQGYSSYPNFGVITDCYIKLFAENVEAILTNKGVGGSTFKRTEGLTCILDTISNSNIDLTQNDFIVVAGGINDVGNQSPLGVFGDETEDTFYGSVELVCRKLEEKYSQVKNIIFITPVNINPNSRYYKEINNLNHYRNAIFEVAVKHNFNVVDGSLIGFPTEDNKFAEYLCTDGVHPSDAGHKFYSDCLLGILR